MKKNKTEISIETYNNIVNEYVEYLKPLYLKKDVPLQKEIEYLISLLPEKSKILDAGTAMGIYPKYLTENCDKNYDVIGIDASTKMIEYATKAVPKTKFKLMDIRNLKFDKKYFDCIICFSTLIHLNDEDCLKTLNKFNEILKDDGILAINVMGCTSNDKEMFVNEPFNPKYKMYYNRYSKDFFYKFFKKNNYTILKTFDNNIYDTDAAGNDLEGTSEFTIIAKKNN